MVECEPIVTMDDLKDENRRLRRVLDQYGRHEDNCAAWTHSNCDCGWEACTPVSGPTLFDGTEIV